MKTKSNRAVVYQTSLYLDLIKVPGKIANQYVDCGEDHWRFTFDRDED